MVDVKDAAATGGGAWLIADCGSTATKLIYVTHDGERWRLAGAADAPTTVESPDEDVTLGLARARDALARRLDGGLPDDVPLLVTSSAGGGLRMLVLGLVRRLTAESARQAALGAGAIVSDVIAYDDPDSFADRVERIRSLRPDIILIGGAVDGGATEPVIALAELLAAAEIGPRFGGEGRLPVIFAGNRDARAGVEAVLGDVYELVCVDNLRPILDREEAGPSRQAIHEIFLRHVMVRAPGYPALLQVAAASVLPTPAAVARSVRALAARRGVDVLAVDVGGATTDIFTVHEGRLRRTVSANLGVSYSIANVLETAGAGMIARWLPAPPDVRRLTDDIYEKMALPTTLPELPSELALEQAAAREALRLALEHHVATALPPPGRRTGEALHRLLHGGLEEPVADPAGVDLLVGAGGALAHAARPEEAMAILLDACLPRGVTRLELDAAGALQHLGALDAVAPAAAAEVLERDVLLPLGTCVAPWGGSASVGESLCSVRVDHPSRGRLDLECRQGELLRIPLAAQESARLKIQPRKGWDAGSGPGRTVVAEVGGGAVGLVLDGRGRPLVWPREEAARRALVGKWREALSTDGDRLGEVSS